MQCDLKPIPHAFSDILQKQVFLFAESEGEISLKDWLAEKKDTQDWVRGRITFAGPMKGDLEFVLSPSLKRAVAANFLGCDPEDEEAEVGGNDAVRELLNVACGNLLTAVVGTSPVFDLGMPQVNLLTLDSAQTSLPNDADTRDGDPMSLAVAFDVEDEPLWLRFSVRP